MTHALFTLLFMAILGVTTKYVDLVFDNEIKGGRRLAYVLAIIYGFLMLTLVFSAPEIAPLILGVVLGVIVGGSIDKLAHVFGVLILVIGLVVFGFPILNLVLLAIFFLASASDEILKNFYDKRRFKGIVGKVVSLRLFVEISALFVSFITGIWLIFLAIFVYDVAYLTTSRFVKQGVGK